MNNETVNRLRGYIFNFGPVTFEQCVRYTQGGPSAVNDEIKALLNAGEIELYDWTGELSFWKRGKHE